MNNSRIFYALLFGFIFGVFLRSLISVSFYVTISFLVLVVILLVLRKYLLIAIFLFSFALGVLRYDLKDDRQVNNFLENSLGQKISIEGVIINEPSVSDTGTRLDVETEDGEKVLVRASLFPRFQYGDQIRATGKLERPENFTSTNGTEFDYVGFLAKDDIFYQISFAQAELVSFGHGSWLKGKLFAFKNYFMSKINSLIKEPESSLLGGLLLGAKNSLGKEWQEKFRLAGVSHIVALSGYNITIVAEGIILALSFLSRTASLSFGALGIFLFAIMTGGSATVLRASIMALLVLLAKATGRIYDVTRALFLAGFFMIIQNPKILVFDISFQLSFLSTLALIYVSPILEKKFLFVTEKYKFREMVVATISTQIFVLPFIFYKMGLISLVALPANIFILPVIPLIMLLGFITGILAMVSGVIALPFALITSLLLSYILKVIDIFSSLSFAVVNIKNFPLWAVVFIYAIFGIIFWRYRRCSVAQSNSH